MPPAAVAGVSSELSLLAQQLDELSGSSSRKRGRRAAGVASEETAAARRAAVKYCGAASRAGRSSTSGSKSIPSGNLFTEEGAGAPFPSDPSSSNSSGEPAWTAAAALRFFSSSRSRDSTPTTAAERERSAASCASTEDLRLVRRAAAAAAERCLPASSQLSPCLAPYYSPVLHPFWLAHEPPPLEEYENEEEEEEFLSSLSQLPSPSAAGKSTAANGGGAAHVSLAARLRSRSSSRMRRLLSSRRAAARRRRRDRSPRELLQQELPQQSPEAAAAAAAALLSCNSFNSYRIAAVVPPAPGKGTWSDDTNLGELLPVLLPEQYENQREEQQQLQRLLLPLQQHGQSHLYMASHDLSQQQQQPRNLQRQQNGHPSALFSAAAAGKAGEVAAEAVIGAAGTEENVTVAAGEDGGEEEKILQLPLPTEQLLALLQGRLTTAGGSGSVGYTSVSSSSMPTGGEDQRMSKEEGGATAGTADMWESWAERSGCSTMSRAFVSASFAAAAATAEAEAQRVAAQSPVDTLQQRQVKVRFEQQQLQEQNADPLQIPAAAVGHPQFSRNATAGDGASLPPAVFARVDSSPRARAAEEGSDSGESEEFPFTSRTPVAATLAAEAAAAEAAAAAEREAASLSAACDAVGRVKLQQVWGAAAAEQEKRRLLLELQQQEKEQQLLEAEVSAIRDLQQKLEMWQTDLTQSPQQLRQQVPGPGFHRIEALAEQQQLPQTQKQHQECAVIVLQQEQPHPATQQQPSLHQQQLLYQPSQEKSDLLASRPGELCSAETKELATPEPQPPITSVDLVQREQQERKQQTAFPQQDNISPLAPSSLPIPPASAVPPALAAENVASPSEGSAAAGAPPTATAVAVPDVIGAAAAAGARGAAVAASPHHSAGPAAAASAPASAAAALSAPAIAASISAAAAPAPAAAALSAPAVAASTSAAAAPGPAVAASTPAAAAGPAVAAASHVAPVCGKRAQQRSRSRPPPTQSSPTATRRLAAAAKAGGTRLTATTTGTGGAAGGAQHISVSSASSKSSAPSSSTSSPQRSNSPLQRSSSPLTFSGSQQQAKLQQKQRRQKEQQKQQKQQQHPEFQLVHPQTLQVKSEPAAPTALSAASETPDTSHISAGAAAAPSQPRVVVVPVPAAGHLGNAADAALRSPSISPVFAAGAVSAAPPEAAEAPVVAAATALTAVVDSCASFTAAPAQAASAALEVASAAATASGPAPAGAAHPPTSAAIDATATTPSAGTPFLLPSCLKLDDASVARQRRQQVCVEQQPQQVKQQQQPPQQQRQAQPLEQQQPNRQQEQLQPQQLPKRQQTLQPPSLQLQEQQVYLWREGKQYVLREQQPEQQRQQPTKIHARVGRTDSPSTLPLVAFSTAHRGVCGSEAASLTAAGPAPGGPCPAGAGTTATAQSDRHPVNAPIIRKWRIINGVATPVLAAPRTTPHAAATPVAAAGVCAPAALRAPSTAAARHATSATLPHVTRAAVKSAAPVAAAEPPPPKKFSLFDKLRLLLGVGTDGSSCTKCVCSSDAPSTAGTSQAGENGQQVQRTAGTAVGEVFPMVWLPQDQQRPVHMQWQLQQPQQHYLQQQQLRQQVQQQHGTQRPVVPQRPTGETGVRAAASSSTLVAAPPDAARPVPLPVSSKLLPTYTTLPTPQDVELHVAQWVPQKQQRQQQETPSHKQLEGFQKEQVGQDQGMRCVLRAPSRLHAVATSAAAPTNRPAGEAASAAAALVYMPASDAAARGAVRVSPSKSALEKAEETYRAAADGAQGSSCDAFAAPQDGAAAYRAPVPSGPTIPTAAAAAYATACPCRAGAAALRSFSQSSAGFPADPQQQRQWRSDVLLVDESKNQRELSYSFGAPKEERQQWHSGDLPQEGGAFVLRDREGQQQLAFQRQLQQLRREQGIYRKHTIAELQQQPSLHTGKEVQQAEVPYILGHIPLRPVTPAEVTHNRSYDSGAFPLDRHAAAGIAGWQPLPLFRNAGREGAAECGAAAGTTDRLAEEGGKGRRKAAARFKELDYKWEGGGEEKKRKSKVPDNWIRFGAEAATVEDTGATAAAAAASGGTTAASDEAWMSRTQPRQKRSLDDYKRKWLQQHPEYGSGAATDIDVKRQRERQQQQQQQVTAEERLCETEASHGEVVQRLLQQRRLLQQQRQRLLKQQRQRSTREREEEEFRGAPYDESVALGVMGLPQHHHHQQQCLQDSRYREGNGRQATQQEQQLQQQPHRQQQRQRCQQVQPLRQQGDEGRGGLQRDHREIDDGATELLPEAVKDKATLFSAATAAVQAQDAAASDECDGKGAIAAFRKEDQQPRTNDEGGRRPYNSSRKSSSRHSKRGSRDLSVVEQLRQDETDSSSSSSGAPLAAVVPKEAGPAVAKSLTEVGSVARAALDAEIKSALGNGGLAGTTSTPSDAAADRSGEAQQRRQERAREAQGTAAAAAAHIAAVAATKAARAADTAIAVLAAATMGTPVDVHTLQQQQKQQQGTLLNHRTDSGSGVSLTASRQLRDEYPRGEKGEGGETTTLATGTEREAYAAVTFPRATKAAVAAHTADRISGEGHQRRATLRAQSCSGFSVDPAAATAAHKYSGASASAAEKKDAKGCRGSLVNPRAASAATAAAAAAAAQAAQEAARRAAANIEEVATAVADPLRPLQQLFSFCTGESNAAQTGEAGENTRVWAARSSIPAPTYYRTFEGSPSQLPATVRIEQPQQQPLVLRYWYKTPPQEEPQQQETQPLRREQREVRDYCPSPVGRSAERPVLCQQSAAAAVGVRATREREYQYSEGNSASWTSGPVTRPAAARGAAARGPTAATYDYPFYVQ